MSDEWLNKVPGIRDIVDDTEGGRVIMPRASKLCLRGNVDVTPGVDEVVLEFAGGVPGPTPTYATTLLNTWLDAANAEADGGSIEILDEGEDVLVAITLSDPAFEPASGGEAHALGADETNPVSVDNALVGTAEKSGAPHTYRVKSAGDDVLWSAPVAGHMVVTPATITESESVSIVAWLSSMG